MNFELECTLFKVYETESKTGTFQTREFVVTTDGNYPQYVKFQCVQDRCGIIDGHKEGDKLKVFFDLRGREWQGKYFTNLNAWRVEKLDSAQASPKAKTSNDDFSAITPGDEPNFGSNFGTEDDLPF